jgi:membrane-associated phospholipid phosphatase
MPEAVSKLDLALLAACAVAAFGLGAAAGFGPPEVKYFRTAAIGIALFGLSGVLTASGRCPRVAAFLGVFSWLAVFAAVMVHLCYISAAGNLPLQDAAFAGFDEALGIDFNTVLALTGANATFATVAFVSYKKSVMLAKIVLFVLVWQKDFQRLRNAIALISTGLIVTLVLSALLPANDAFYYYSLTDKDAGHLAGSGVGLWHLEHYSALRDGTMRVFPVGGWKGIITFPSYHVILAIVVPYALWNTRWMRVPATIFAAFIAFTTMPIGGHYFADVVGGGAIAGLIIWGLERRGAKAPAAAPVPAPLVGASGAPANAAA